MIIREYRFFPLCLIIFFLLVYPVSADEIYPTITHVFFDKDGVPFNGSVHYTVNCYGVNYFGKAEPAVPAHNAAPSTEVVYSYTASCPEYGCIIYEPYHVNYLAIDRCDVVGTAAEKPFTIANFSSTPIPDCTELQPYTIGGGRRGGYYNSTPEYDACVNETRRHRDRCDQYLAPCDPVSDKECGNWVIDGKEVKETPSYRACTDTVDRERTDCDQFLKRIDLSTMVMWKDAASGSEDPARRACELRLTIPSDSRTPASDQKIPGVVPGESVSTIIHYQPPIESLYCSILSIFGARC